MLSFDITTGSIMRKIKIIFLIILPVVTTEYNIVVATNCENILFKVSTHHSCLS